MVYNFETFRNNKETASDSTIPKRLTSVISKRIYESAKLKNWMCELLYARFPKSGHIYCFVHREFNDPHPEDHIIREPIGNFTVAIDMSRSEGYCRDTTLRVPFRHDVHNFLFQNKQELSLGDFESKYFPFWWNQHHECYGTINYTYHAHDICFLIRTKCYLVTDTDSDCGIKSAQPF